MRHAILAGATLALYLATIPSAQAATQEGSKRSARPQAAWRRLIGRKIMGHQLSGRLSMAPKAIIAGMVSRKGQILTAELVGKDKLALLAMGCYRFIDVEPTEKGKDGVIIQVRLMENPRVRSIAFKGNRTLTSWRLRKAVTIEKGKVLNVNEITKSAESINRSYADAGYFACGVLQPTHWSFEPITATVIFQISEPRFRRLLIFGECSLPRKRLKTLLGLKEGKPLKRKSLLSTLKLLEKTGKLSLRDKPRTILTKDLKHVDVQLMCK